METSFFADGRMGIIYRATNQITGMVYVGKTMDRLCNRKAKHKHAAIKKNIETYFCRTIRKYGFESFVWDVIGIWPIELLNMFEEHAIKLYDCMNPNGYNLTVGGGGSYGFKHSEESLKKMSMVHLGAKRLPMSEETKIKIGNGNRGKPHTIETINKRKDTMLKRYGCFYHHTQEFKNRLGNCHRGINRNPETIEKIRIANIGKRCSNETKEKLRNINTGKHHSTETKEKISLALKKYFKYKPDTQVMVTIEGEE